MPEIVELSPEELLEMVIPSPGVEEVEKGQLTLYVNPERFSASVHQDLSCIDCHSYIEELPHPQNMGMVDCGACHEEIVAQYEPSKHAKVSERLCFECHNPHTAQSFRELSQQQRIAICQQCHEDFGHEWLPQPHTHLQSLECTTCHAAKAEKGLFLYVTAENEDGTRTTVSFEQLRDVAKETGGDLATLADRDGNGALDVIEAKGFLATLERGGIRVPDFAERVLVTEPYHNFTDEIADIKDCTSCHVARAPFYSDVVLELPTKEGVTSVPVDRTVIESMPPIPSQDQYYETVHGKVGVECIDCHADLTVLKKGRGREFTVAELETPVCGNCHDDIMEEYQESLHAQVSNEICFGCHNPHSVVPYRELTVDERVAICTKCHEPTESHDWLPQPEAHFRHLECSICHAPQAETGLVFSLQARTKDGDTRRLTYQEVAKALGPKSPDLAEILDGDGNGLLSDAEVLSFLKTLRSRSTQRIELGLNVVVLRPSHNYTDKGTKAKDCAVCHSSQAGFYSALVLEFPEEGGGSQTMPVEKSILVGMHPVPVTSNFYVLGEGKFSKRDVEELRDKIFERDIGDLFFVIRKIGYKWLDVIGVLFLLGGLGFVGLHSTIRILTIGLRRKREDATRKREGE
jgi:predicted CXXCH cytochrome family protein